MMSTQPFALTAIGTIRGRVSRRELCLASIESELSLVVFTERVFDAAAFTSISVVVHLGEAFLPPRVWGIAPQSGTLEVAVGVPFAEIRRREPHYVCAVMRKAAVEALVAGFERYGLPVTDLQAALSRG